MGGSFQQFTTGDGVGEDFSAIEDVGMGMSNRVRGIGGPKNWPNGVGTEVVARAQLQRSTNGGMTWSEAEATALFYVR